jgi:hypothetical protein
MPEHDPSHSLDKLIDDLISREGGYSNHPADRGGPTKFGVTEAVARAHGYTGSMALLPRGQAAAIYRRLYWVVPGFDQVVRRSPASPPSCSTPGSTWVLGSPPPFSSARRPR